ncbi:hypothetical protein KEM54_006352 [Ascosphaera aggregata]|nr:hypothetical protein KEM54_006352 [Ascosphaera aggregata]
MGDVSEKGMETSSSHAWTQESFKTLRCPEPLLTKTLSRTSLPKYGVRLSHDTDETASTIWGNHDLEAQKIRPSSDYQSDVQSLRGTKPPSYHSRRLPPQYTMSQTSTKNSTGRLLGEGIKQAFTALAARIPAIERFLWIIFKLVTLTVLPLFVGALLMMAMLYVGILARLKLSM